MFVAQILTIVYNPVTYIDYWNVSFILRAEGANNPVYYLDY